MLVLKAFAFDNRGAEKDVYDIYYLLHELGVDAAVEALNRYLADKEHASDVKDALALLERDFSDMDGVAAGSLARFMNDESNEELRADVVGAVGAVVRRLRI
jgi:predicted nucleotidyltransferase component of viral defense system